MDPPQEQRTQQAFLEVEAAERETERRLRTAWPEDEVGLIRSVRKRTQWLQETEDEEAGAGRMEGSVERLSQQVERELELSDRLDRELLRWLAEG
jgi:hypothetical protein